MVLVVCGCALPATSFGIYKKQCRNEGIMKILEGNVVAESGLKIGIVGARFNEFIVALDNARHSRGGGGDNFIRLV